MIYFKSMLCLCVDIHFLLELCVDSLKNTTVNQPLMMRGTEPRPMTCSIIGVMLAIKLGQVIICCSGDAQAKNRIVQSISVKMNLFPTE